MPEKLEAERVGYSLSYFVDTKLQKAKRHRRVALLKILDRRGRLFDIIKTNDYSRCARSTNNLSVWDWAQQEFEA